MARHFITLREVGESTSWLLVQQAIGIPDAKMVSDFMKDRVALLLFARQCLPERLCVTSAVRQMGGTTIYEGDPGGVWRQELLNFQHHLLPIFGYYLDCMYVYDFLSEDLNEPENVPIPVINAGNRLSHPAHALADIACMLKSCKDLRNAHAAWIGCDNGTLYSLVAAMAWFPFSLRICLPPQVDSSQLRAMVERLQSPVEFISTPHEAVKGVNFIFAGRREDVPQADISPWPVDKNWVIDEKLINLADPDVRLMLSASPVRAIPIQPSVLSHKGAMLRRQAEYRLRVHKRILHWVFEK